jgi:hypothetical protein
MDLSWGLETPWFKAEFVSSGVLLHIGGTGITRSDEVIDSANGVSAGVEFTNGKRPGVNLRG